MSITELIIVSAAATYIWRFTGTLLAGRITAQSAAFRYATIISYAIVGALIFKLIVYPQGATAETPLLARLLALAVTLAVFYTVRRSVALGAWCGVATFLLVNRFVFGG